MKFFYINNSQCCDCEKCGTSCPTGAIYVSEGKRFIDYDRCTSCGSCMKCCNSDAVWYETVGQMISRVEKSDLYQTRIRRLEKELASMRVRVDHLENNLDRIILNAPFAAAVAEKNGTMVIANTLFSSLAGIDPLRLADMPANLEGENIFNIMPSDMGRVMRLPSDGENERYHVTVLDGKQIAVNIQPLSGDLLFFTLKDLSDHNTSSEEILGLLKGAIDRKMEMVQKIGTLLGDEASEEINDLTTAIRIMEGSSHQ